MDRDAFRGERHTESSLVSGLAQIRDRVTGAVSGRARRAVLRFLPASADGLSVAGGSETPFHGRRGLACPRYTTALLRTMASAGEDGVWLAVCVYLSVLGALSRRFLSLNLELQSRRGYQDCCEE